MMGTASKARTRTKVCGITTEDDRDLAVAAGADALGFIVAVSTGSPREISAARAGELIADVPPLTTSVLVTMPESIDEAAQLCAQTGADVVQVHGSISPEALAALGERTNRPIIAAVDATDQIVAPATAADAVLIDSAGDDGAGGTGRTHDWSRTADLTAELDVPVVLAGGLTADNVATAVETVQPFAVDAASGLEQAGGVKNPEAVRAFVAAAVGEGPA
jgi:phosphoribosylanthranilate isomerase (EC 5.3.1.24)